METIVLSGYLAEDCESCTDKNGHRYGRFKVRCKSFGFDGQPILTVYRCICYSSACEVLKSGDQVFLQGSLTITARADETGKIWINPDVMVQSITRGTKSPRGDQSQGKKINYKL